MHRPPWKCPLGSAASCFIYADVQLHIPMTMAHYNAAGKLYSLSNTVLIHDPSRLPSSAILLQSLLPTLQTVRIHSNLATTISS